MASLAESLIAPFFEKRNLVTIIIVAVFFGVYRFSGGAVSTKTRTLGQSDKSYFSSPFEKSDSVSPAGDLEALTRPEPNRGLLDNMLQDPEPKKQAPERGTRLDEIEKSLGLR